MHRKLAATDNQYNRTRLTQSAGDLSGYPMNLTQSPTLDQLIQLIARVDDTKDSHILYVSKNGDVHLTAFRADTAAGSDYANEDTLQFILDTFMIGKGFVGWQATQDSEWMEEIFLELNEHWTYTTTGFAWKTN